MSDLATPESAAAEKESAPSHDGSFIWYELMTSDQDAAIAFYTAVAGWTAADQTMAELDFRYTLLSAGGRPIAGLMELNGEMCEAGARPGWIGVIAVPDTDAAAAKIASAGGSIHVEPADIPNVGRFALVADPGGAVFELMTPQPTEQEMPPPDPKTPGHFSWHELHSEIGQEAAFAFYSAQFGWETYELMDMGAMGKYRIFGKNGVPLGGMMDKPAGAPNGGWGFYFTVDGIDAAIGRIEASGGKVMMPPHEVPGGSWIVQATDPQGANFALTSARR